MFTELLCYLLAVVSKEEKPACGSGSGKRMDETDQATENQYLYFMNERFKYWLKRVGWGGFLFFLIKGLLWLLIPYLIAKGILSK